MATEICSQPELERPVSSRQRIVDALPDKLDTLIVVVLCFIQLLTWLPRIRGPIDLRWDAGTYYVLGTSLAQGHGYRLLNEPGDIQAIQYTPGVPALVAAHELLLGTDDPLKVGISLRWSWCLLSLFYVAAVYCLARRFFSRLFATLITLTCLFNYQLLFFSTLCFAELPFACTSVLFGCLYFRKRQGVWSQIGIASAAIASYLLRTSGIALLVAWIADAALRKNFRHAAMRAAIALVPVALWYSYVHSVESSYAYKHPSYMYQRDPWVFYNVSYATNVALKEPFRPEQGRASAGDLAARFLRNAVTMPSVLGSAISGKKGFWDGHLKRLDRFIKPWTVPEWGSHLILVPLGAIVIAGLVWMLFRRQWLIPCYVFLTIAAVCTTAWPGQFSRYLAPIEAYALIGFFTLLGGASTYLRRRFPGTRLALLPLAAAGVIVVESIASTFVGFRNFRDPAVYQDDAGREHAYVLLHYPGGASAFEHGLRWLVEHADRRAVVAISMPPYAYLKTGLKAVMPPLEKDPAKAQQMVDSVPITYMALDQMLNEDDFNKRFPALMRTYPDKWRLVFASPGHAFDIYERVGARPTKDFEPVATPHGRPLRF